MNKDIALCDNKNCEAYRERYCLRAKGYIRIIDSGWKSYINMIPKREGTKQCDLFLPKRYNQCRYE